jgi:hypothetical protein
MSKSAQGVLMAIMEPDPLHDEEFNAWYDLEHIPQMSSIPGILQATRWVCVTGWPRYLATYDLEHVDVLKSEDYRQATGANFTPWARRMLGRVRGWRRLALTGLDPSAAPLDEATDAFDLLFVEDADGARKLVDAVSSERGVIQARAFEVSDEGFGIAVVEAGGLRELPDTLPETGSRLRHSARYVRYHRGDPFHAFNAIDTGAVH